MPMTSYWCLYCFYYVFIVNFEHIFLPFSIVSIVDFEQVNASWFIKVHKKLKMRRNLGVS